IAIRHLIPPTQRLRQQKIWAPFLLRFLQGWEGTKNLKNNWKPIHSSLSFRQSIISVRAYWPYRRSDKFLGLLFAQIGQTQQKYFLSPRQEGLSADAEHLQRLGD